VVGQHEGAAEGELTSFGQARGHLPAQHPDCFHQKAVVRTLAVHCARGSVGEKK
jgi:hypothetical protein